MNNKSKAREAYEQLQKRRNKLKRNGIILAMFLLVVNTYAWFVYLAKASLTVDASVIGWDIKFYDEDGEEMDVTINIKDLYPGMKDYQKKIIITNDSSLKGEFSYTISDLKLIGIESDIKESNQLVESLQNDYPFKVTFESDKNELDSDGDFANFYIRVVWPFESDNKYTLIKERNKFQELYPYYKLDNQNYIIDEEVTSINFLDKVNSGIYMDSDDIDTFWGEQAVIYKENNPDKGTLTFKLNMRVEQVE